MADIVAIRKALAKAASSVSGLSASDTVLDAVNPPTFVVGEVEMEYDQAFQRGLDQLDVKCRLYASRADASSGQSTLDAFMGSGPKSVKSALEADRTLGGVAETLRVTKVSGYGVYEAAGVLYLGAEFHTTVWAKGV